jgi:serine protease Do/serine protease DegQ
MHSLIDTGTVARGFMGVTTNPKPLTPDMAESFGAPKDTKGVLITDLTPDGPAAKAGLKREDIITGINSKPVTSREDLRLIIAQTAPGTQVAVSYLRDGKAGSLDVTLTKLPEDNAAEGELLPGVSVTPLTGDLRKDLHIDDRIDGIVITDITEASPYRDIFPQGAVIEAVNRVPVADLAAAKRVLHPGRNLALVNNRGGRRFVVFEAP